MGRVVQLDVLALMRVQEEERVRHRLGVVALALQSQFLYLERTCIRREHSIYSMFLN